MTSKIKIAIFLVTIFSTLSLLTGSGQTAPVPRVLIQSDSYRLSKYEPKEGTYLGAYVVQDTYIKADMQKFNELTGKNHASFFRYVGYGQKFPQSWIQELQKVGAVPHIAWEPNEGLDAVQDDLYLRSFARSLKETGMPVFLRFASEMNGTWAAYSGNPQKYIAKWRLVHDVMAEEAPNVMMVWTVFTFPQNTILQYYPGDKYVDWVGVNIYNVVYHNDQPNQRADHEDPLELLDYVYNTFSDRKPIQISEFGVTHYTVTDNRYYIDFARNKLSRMYRGLVEKYPRVKSIFYFDVNNLINAPEGRKINNYAITDDPQVLSAYSKLIKNSHYLSNVGEDLEGQKDKELFNLKDPIYVVGSVTYVPAASFAKYTGAALTVNKYPQSITLTKNGAACSYRIYSRFTPNGAVLRNNRNYIPLKQTAWKMGYQVNWDPTEYLITISK
ncbi:glycosyl hydrolase [Bacillota bacterium LX-D]|nr:glycosyl hydrolase [Bacillota bacterium LX-D]